ncbi:MAG: STAS domain-containing protein [Pseudomonadales bacterium]|nr:STAS domain-containing protein [Pseudomonadales bacterium]
MAKSTASRVLYAVHQGTYVLKLIGDIRVTCCAALDEFIENVFKDPNLTAVVVDLSETTIIDSTALGLIAKVAVFFRKSFDIKPVIISTNPDITRILDSMGFEAVFNIIHEAPVIDTTMADVSDKGCTEAYATQKVLEAHQILMGMNDANAETFKDVVATLKEQEAAIANASCSERADNQQHVIK